MESRTETPGEGQPKRTSEQLTTADCTDGPCHVVRSNLSSESPMKLPIIFLSAAVVAAGTGCAQMPLGGEPVQSVSAYRHGNLAAAQDMVREAYDRLSDAQAANDSHLGGHAARAKELLREAGQEIGLAADFANRR